MGGKLVFQEDLKGDSLNCHRFKGQGYQYFIQRIVLKLNSI